MACGMLRSRRGYTLVEALVSILLATLAFASMAFVLNNGFRTAAENRTRMYAENAIREEMEIIRSMTYNNIVALGDASSFNNAQLGKLDQATGVRRIANAFDANIKKITLTVTWTAPSGRVLTQSITTYVTQGGINA